MNKLKDDAKTICLILKKDDNCSISELLKKSKLTMADLYTAIGWLANANKIDIEYQNEEISKVKLHVINFYF